MSSSIRDGYDYEAYVEAWKYIRDLLGTCVHILNFSGKDKNKRFVILAYCYRVLVKWVVIAFAVSVVFSVRKTDLSKARNSNPGWDGCGVKLGAGLAGVSSTHESLACSDPDTTKKLRSNKWCGRSISIFHSGRKHTFL